VRQAVVLGALAALLLVLPAAARTVDDDVTVRVGQTVRLKTFFAKDRKYTIVMSGLVTLTLKDGTGKQIYDPFHGMQGPNCEQSGVGVYLQIKDSRGDTINASDAYKPPVYTVPCRSDHRYEFQLNDAYPPSWDIAGAADAYIPLEPDPRYWTASGSFSLIVRPAQPRRDVVFKARGKKETTESARDALLADVTLSGAGRIRDVDGDAQATGLFKVTLVWLTREDTQLTLAPTGKWRYNASRQAVLGPLKVVRSSDGTCLKKTGMRMTLSKLSGLAAVGLSGCNGLSKAFWTYKRSDLTLIVDEVRVG
jgi:hypothetical protein